MFLSFGNVAEAEQFYSGQVRDTALRMSCVVTLSPLYWCSVSILGFILPAHHPGMFVVARKLSVLYEKWVDNKVQVRVFMTFCFAITHTVMVLVTSLFDLYQRQEPELSDVDMTYTGICVCFFLSSLPTPAGCCPVIPGRNRPHCCPVDVVDETHLSRHYAQEEGQCPG